MANDPANPATGFEQGDFVRDVPSSFVERLGRVLRPQPGDPLEQAIAEHHMQRLDQARMYRKNANTAAGTLIYDNQQLQKKQQDPNHPDLTGYNFLTDEQRSALQNQYQEAQDQFEKITGVNKDIKGAHAKARGIVDQLIQRPGGMQTPPTPQYGSTVMEGGVTQTPPPPPPPAISPQGTATSSGGFPISNAAGPNMTPPPALASQNAQELPPEVTLPFQRQQMLQQQELQNYAAKERALYQLKIEEDQAKAKAKATAGSGGATPRPVFSHPVGILDARKLSGTGQVFEDKNGDPIDLDQIPDTMSLQPYTTRVTETDADGNSKQVWKVRYIPMSPNQKTFTVGNETYAANPADVSKPGAPTPLGQHNVPTTSTRQVMGFNAQGLPTKYGLSTTRTPSTTGITGQGTSATPAPSGGATPKAAGGSASGKAKPSAELVFPSQPFMQLSKGATNVDQARNSLVGDNIEKGQVGGLAKDLDVFKNPDSIKRIGEYLQLVNNHVANEGDAVASHGNVTDGIRWWVGLPQAVIGLQQGALRDSYAKLTTEDKKFVADYFRTMGTMGGMRASTGMPGYQWAFTNMYNEMPTPGTVNDYDDAVRRVMNYVNETNVVSKRNRLVGKVDTEDAEKQIRGGGGRKGGVSAAPTPGGPPKTADEFLSKYGIKTAKP